jgi:site-specific recombinase XerD
MQDIPEPVSFDTALERFLKHLQEESRSSATRIAYSSDLEQLKKHMESHRITQATTIQTGHLEDYVSSLFSQNYTAKSISRKINSLKTFFRYLHSEKMVTSNPAEILPHPKYDVKPPRFLTPEEYKSLRDVSRLDIRISAIIEILLQTGMRISELANLRLEDIRKNEIFIKSLENNPSRTISIPKSAYAAISNYLSMRPQVKDDHLFVTKTGHPLLIRNIRTSVDRYFRKAGLKGAKVNDLRHTFIAHQLKNGVQPEVIHKHVGHKRLSSTQKYLTHLHITEELTLTRIIEL